jgi:hypothetical protein
MLIGPRSSQVNSGGQRFLFRRRVISSYSKVTAKDAQRWWASCSCFLFVRPVRVCSLSCFLSCMAASQSLCLLGSGVRRRTAADAGR